jgi:hypothetical protein
MSPQQPCRKAIVVSLPNSAASRSRIAPGKSGETDRSPEITGWQV